MPNIESILRRGFEDFRDFVNPLVHKRVTLAGEPMRILHTRGGQLIDDENKVIECFHGTQAFGHRNPFITKAVRDFLDSDSANWYPSRVNPYAGTLGKVLCERASRGTPAGQTAPYSWAYFANSGAEAVESAIKLGRAVTRRPKVLGLEQAYHGCTMGACALMDEGIYRDMFGPHLADVHSIPYDDVDELHRWLKNEDVAVIVVESLQLEGGVRPLPPNFVDALCELTKKYGTLLVADEVQTGLGRTGKFLATENWPRRPDAVLLAKHLGGGLLPVSAMLSRRDLYEKAYGASFEHSEANNCTFSGNAMVSVAGLAAMELLDDTLIKRVGDMGREFQRAATAALSDLPLFKEVRGEGFAQGIVVRNSDHPWLSFEHFGMPELAAQPSTGLLLCHRLYKRGYFCFVCGHDWSVLRIQPRFNIESEQLMTFVRVVREELEYLCNLV